jgi:two-component system, chemotaxis family, protein-glutamate methylesterase/glutaminase
MTVRICLAVKSAFNSVALRRTLAGDPELQLVAEERDCTAVARMLQANPGTVALVDLELLSDPDGHSLQVQLAARREPTVLINARGAAVPESLSLKRTVFVLSSRNQGSLDIGHIQDNLLAAIRAVRVSKAQEPSGAAAPRITPSPATPATPLQQSAPPTLAPKRGPADLVVIGVSTGGPPLLVKMLKGLQKPTIPTLIAQHMPAGETFGFALRLSEECAHPVIEVGQGPLPEIGVIGLVQSGKDFQILSHAPGKLRLKEANVPGNPFHPGIDHLLQTAAEAGIATHTVILTGMGQDGAIGALALSKQGFPVIAQRPETCAVAGMPNAAIQNGAARQIQSPEQIVESINRWYSAARSAAL